MPYRHRIRIWLLSTERVLYRMFVESALCDSITRRKITRQLLAVSVYFVGYVVIL